MAPLQVKMCGQSERRADVWERASSHSCARLILTNMYPTPESPSAGVFIKDQVESLKGAGVSVRLGDCRSNRGDAGLHV